MCTTWSEQSHTECGLRRHLSFVAYKPSCPVVPKTHKTVYKLKKKNKFYNEEEKRKRKKLHKTHPLLYYCSSLCLDIIPPRVILGQAGESVCVRNKGPMVQGRQGKTKKLQNSTAFQKPYLVLLF